MRLVCFDIMSSIELSHVIMRRAFHGTVIQAVKEATRRSMQLGGVSDAEIANKYNL